MKVSTKKIYIADDGKEFINEKDCKSYEQMLSNIKFFCVRYEPELTETGYYTRKTYVAVLSNHYFFKDIVINWAFKKFNTYLCESVQGIGFQPFFSVSECSSNEYLEAPPTRFGACSIESDKIFLSPTHIDGFPENYNYMEKWGFK